MSQEPAKPADEQNSQGKSNAKNIALFLFAVFFVVIVGPAFYFIDGVVGYFQGTAKIKKYRSVITPNDYFDRELRVPCGIYIDRTHADFGPKASELDHKITETLNFGPNNTAIRLMIKWFGPMKNTFQGEIPSKEEAFEAISNVPKTIESENFFRPMAKTGLAKNPKLIPQYQNMGGSAIMSPLTYGKVGWTTWKDATLIVGNSSAIWLIDKKSGQIYGGYSG